MLSAYSIKVVKPHEQQQPPSKTEVDAIMGLNQFQYEFVQEQIKEWPTSKLHLVKSQIQDGDYNSPAKDDLLSIIELELKKRRKQAQVKNLNNSLRASNPVGRVISSVKGFFIRSSRKS